MGLFSPDVVVECPCGVHWGFDFGCKEELKCPGCGKTPPPLTPDTVILPPVMRNYVWKDGKVVEEYPDRTQSAEKGK